MTVFDARICGLGEGALWHPRRGQLFWFDILGKRMLTQTPDGPQDWTFAEMVSAAGWLDHDNLLIASETALFRFDLTTGQRHNVVALEANNPATRSNDGRADRQGGFWIGTMG
jgi:sugar lactone lactonase YvrE